MYDIIQRMLTPGVLFAWTIILCDLSEILSGCKGQRTGFGNSAQVSFSIATVSPNLRPYDVYSPQYRTVYLPLILAIFYGYEVFTRGNTLWAIREAVWGSTLIPWMVLVGMCLMALGWYVYGRVTQGKWNLGITRILRIDVVSGCSPILEAHDGNSGNRFQRAGKWLLDKI